MNSRHLNESQIMLENTMLNTLYREAFQLQNDFYSVDARHVTFRNTAVAL